MLYSFTKENIMQKKKGKIQSRIVTITVVSLITMCLMVSAVSYIVFNRYLYQSLIQSSSTSLELLSDSIDSSIDSIYRMVRFCQSNSSISEYIKESPNQSPVLSVATYDRIYEEYANNPASGYIPRLAVVTDEHFLQIVTAIYSQDIDLSKEVKSLDFFESLINSQDYNFETGFIKDPFCRNGIMVLPIIRPITYKYNSETGGILFMEISSSLFTDAFSRYNLTDDSHLYLSVCGHFYLYKENALTEIETLPEELVTHALTFPGISISQSISSSELNEEARLLYYVIFGIILSIILIGVVEMFMLNRMISEPVSKLKAKMDKVSKGDFLRDSSIEWDTELGVIGKGINDLAEDVNLLMEKRVEDEKQKRDLEYKVLQSQINPHFIYNTLNSIKWMATVQGADGISEMTTALAKLLKSISKGTSTLVSIEEEISLLNDYFTIQSYRYGGTITLSLDFADIDVKKYSIIKFTLQPIVENAIFHGLEPKGNGKILVKASYEDNGIVILVHDDGVGMSEEKVKALLTKDQMGKSEFFRELGVKNVHERLQYEFGKEYGLTIQSKENEYTDMYIHIPLKEVSNV